MLPPYHRLRRSASKGVHLLGVDTGTHRPPIAHSVVLNLLWRRIRGQRGRDDPRDRRWNFPWREDAPIDNDINNDIFHTLSFSELCPTIGGRL